MRPAIRLARQLGIALVILSCTPDQAVGPGLSSPVGPSLGVSGSAQSVVISQIYGGGGNSGATYKNDFIELLNNGVDAVSLNGWSVQYASASGTSWGKTDLSGSLAPGRYLLIQEAAGTAGTVNLSPDFAGTLAMSGTAGKVALVRSTNLLTCGTSASPCNGVQVADFVGYGTASSGAAYFEGSSAAATLSNTTAALRKANGCTDSNNNGADFTSGSPAPRNSGTAAVACPGVVLVGPVATVALSPSTSTISPNGTKQFSAQGKDSNGADSPSTYSWSLSPANQTIASISTSGLVTSLGPEGTVTVTATSANGIAGTATLTVAQPGAATITISVGDPKQAPVGYTKPAFATVKDGNGATITSTTTLTWSSISPGIASVDQLGYITGVSPGTAVIRATAPNGVFGSVTFTVLGEASTTAIYRNNVEFGVPTDGNSTDDHIMSRPQYALSYNKNKGEPNWVSWNINASQFGAAPRCDCFSADQSLPSDFYHVVDFNYRNGGYDRGHMVQSESRTTTDQENATTFLLTNIIPQAAENNQGPWSKFENYLNDLARGANGPKKEVYVIAGGIYTGSPGTLKNEGKVQIPGYTWKIAVIVPAGMGLDYINSATDISSLDLEVDAIKMPNDTTGGVPASAKGIRNIAWDTYKVKVDQLEAETGYDFLANLRDDIELLAESGDKPPVAVWGGSTSGVEGSAVSFNGSGSTDPDNDPLTYAWDFGDGSSGTGVAPSHTYRDNGVYRVRLTVTDPIGATSSASRDVSISNVAPTATFANNGPVDEGDHFSLSLTGAFDPSSADMANLEYRFNCGSGFQAEWSSSPSVSCATTDNGTFAVAAEIRDDDGGSSSYAATVTVNNVAPVAVFGDNGPVDEGSHFTLSFSSPSDPSSADAAAGLLYSFNCGTGFGVWGISASASCATSDQGVLSVGGKVKDKDGGTSTYSSSVTVNNVAPTGTFSTSAPVNEGVSYTISISGAADASPIDQATGFTYRFDCGGGAGFGNWSAAASAACPAGDNPGYNSRGEIRDKDDAVTAYGAFSAVNNVAPSVVLSSPSPITSGGIYAVSGGFGDPGQSDGAWSYTINWGDGTSATGSAAIQGALAGSHQYLLAGSYTVTLSVTDKDGGRGSASTTLYVQRIAGAMAVNPNAINISANGTGEVIATVFGSSRFDGGMVDPASIRIGTVAADVTGNGGLKVSVGDFNGDGIGDLRSHFERSRLVSDGQLTRGTTQLTLNANLRDGRQIAAVGEVRVLGR